MVRDTATRAVAIVDDVPAIGLSEKTAQRFADMLNSQDGLWSVRIPEPTNPERGKRPRFPDWWRSL